MDERNDQRIQGEGLRAVATIAIAEQYLIRNNVLHHDDSQNSTDSISAPNHSGAIYPMNSLTIRYLVIVVGFSAITVSYWLAADPPNPWIFAITAAGILVSIGITLAKKRAGHFDNPDPTRAPDPELREILTGTPWRAILVPCGLAILVILAVLAVVLWDQIKTS